MLMTERFIHTAEQGALLAAAEDGDERAFSRLVEPYRRTLEIHCYRMLGSPHDAEDVVQETLLRAWRGLDSFHRRASVHTWLYRIATNACLDELRRRPRRPEPVQPFPDARVEEAASPAYDPAARYAQREGIELALLSAIQHLPGRQRAVLILRDVLGWTAPEAAELLDSTVAAVNSALQRARATIDAQLPATSRTSAGAGQRELLARYVDAWERVDIDGLVALLREDAVMRMPPQRMLRGPEAIGRFFREEAAGGDIGRVAVRPTSANGRPAVAMHVRSPTAHPWVTGSWSSTSMATRSSPSTPSSIRACRGCSAFRSLEPHGCLELVQRRLDPLDHRPGVVHLFAVGHDTHVDVVAVAEDGDVEPHAVDDDRYRERRLQPGAGAVERFARTGDVRDHQVHRRARPAEHVDGRPGAEREHRRRDQAGRVGEVLGGEGAVALLRAAQRFVGALERMQRIGFGGRDRDDHERDPVAEAALLAGRAHRHRDHRYERLVGQLTSPRQPAAQRAGAEGHEHVVHRGVGRVLDCLDPVERERAEREAPVRRDRAVEAGARRLRGRHFENPLVLPRAQRAH